MIASGVASDGAEGVDTEGSGGGIPNERIRGSGEFGAEVYAIEKELNAGDGDVVGGVGGESDIAGDGGVVERVGDGDCGKLGVGAYWRVHVHTDFGFGQSPIVNADFIDQAMEELAGPDVIATDAEWIIRSKDCPRYELCLDVDAIDIKFERRAIKRGCEMGPDA